MEIKKKPKTIKEFSVFYEDEVGKPTKEKTYLLVEPTAKAVRDSRWQYSIVFSQALKDGLLTQRQMSQMLEDSGEESEKESAKLTALYIQAGTVEQKLGDSEDLDIKTQLAEELRELRMEIFQEEQDLRAPYYNTAEQRAEEIRAEFLMQHMVRQNDSNLTLVWPTEEDFEQETDSILLETARTQFLYWLHNVSEDWEKNLPENKVMEQLLQDRTERAEEAEKVEEQEKKPSPKKKKRGRPKKSTKPAATSAVNE